MVWHLLVNISPWIAGERQREVMGWAVGIAPANQPAQAELVPIVGMARICHIYNTLQIPKYLKIGNFVKFLSCASSKTKIIHQNNCTCQNQMFEK